MLSGGGIVCVMDNVTHINNQGVSTMIKKCFLLLFFCHAAIFAGDTVTLNRKNVRMSGRVYPEKVSFSAGEKMTFIIKWKTQQKVPSGRYFVQWKRTGDDNKVQVGKVPFEKNDLTVTTSMQSPGFIRVEAKLTDASGKPCGPFFDGGAGVDIDKIDSFPAPADFNAFWKQQRRKLAGVPVKELERVKDRTSSSEVFQYRVKVASPGGRPVTGYLTIPAGAAAGSQKAYVLFYGYGSRGQSPQKLRKDGIYLEINAHGFELGRDKAYYSDFTNKIKHNGKPYAFSKIQNSNRETAYFNGMSLRVLRALQYIKTLPEWDGKNLIVQGGSQGALQAVWGAANDPDVTLAEIFIPWFCDISGKRRNPPRLEGWQPYWTAALEYFDPVHHALRIKCPVFITSAGLGDYTCPPSGVMAFYNNLQVPKKIKWFQGMQHGYMPKNPQFFEFFEKWADK